MADSTGSCREAPALSGKHRSTDVDRVVAAVEVTKDDEAFWTTTTHVDLPTLRRVVAGRRPKARRTPITSVLAISRAVSNEHGIRTLGQFFAARRILDKRKRNKGAAKFAARAGQRFLQTRCRQYNSTALREYKRL